MKTPNILKILLELQKRRQGYLFGGPLVSWCKPEKKDKKNILIERAKYSGCKKYAQCTIISDDVKWKAWDELEIDEKHQLEEYHCYRASKHGSNETPTYTWDAEIVKKRAEPEWKWVGNPFGIRNEKSLNFLHEIHHRDIKPCSLGGCITPEMQAEYNKDIVIANVKNYWGEIKACPFYFKSKDEKFDTFEKNIARFAQCYATQKEVIDLLKENGFITASTLYRDIYNKNNPDMFWYPFFSGYSYIQLPYLTNKNDKGWDKFTPQLRWHATTIQRLSSAYLPNTKKIFTSCETGTESSKRHAEIRFIDVCDGYASWMLLTWIIIKRIEAAEKNPKAEMKNKLIWEYAEQDSLFSKLENLGFKSELSKVLNLESIDGKIFRNSTLKEDLDILGLCNEQNTESRFKILFLWLQNVTNKKNKTKIEKLVGPIINSTINEVCLNYENFIDDFISHVNNVIVDNTNNKNVFIESFILNPPVHIIVRAFLTTPIRWCFIPINTDLDDINNKTTLTSGIIVLVEDSTESKSYKPKISNNRNIIMNRFNIIFPLLSAVNNIEEQNLRDEEEKKRRSIEDERERYATRAAISQVMARNMSHNIGSHVLSRLIDQGQIERLNFSETNTLNFQTSYRGLELNITLEDTSDSLIANFNSYLKSRMDFLADITTGVPNLENSKWFYKELILGIDKNRLLLNRISGVGNFYFKFIAKYNDKILNETDNDFMVSVPNDILGCHAFYIIIENIIRNCAKHGGGDSSPCIPIVITLDVKDCPSEISDDSFEIHIYDSIPLDENKLTELVYNQNCRLNNSILNNGVLRQGAWGLIEMDASAAYLRKIPVELIDTNDYNINLNVPDSCYPDVKDGMPINILKAIAIEKKYLGYRFFMYKPREILIIDTCQCLDNIENTKRKDLLKEGISICNTKQDDTNQYQNNNVYNHKLVIVLYNDNKSEAEKLVNENKTGLSERILYVPMENGYYKKLNDVNGFKENAWIEYVKLQSYAFYSQYTILGILPKIYSEWDKITSIKRVQNGAIAYYSDHGGDYEKKLNANNRYPFIDITYSAVNGFKPDDYDLVSQIQLVESTHNKIVIVDERIQEYASTAKYKPKGGMPDIEISKIYESTNIIVPNIYYCDLNNQSFDNEFCKIIHVFENNRVASFYVIHLGIIEKLIESYNRLYPKCSIFECFKGNKQKYNKESEIKDFLVDLICDPYNIEYNKIIIISGRGTPHNLPANTRYLNYSIISQYMIDLRFKFLLSEAIFSARKIIKQ